MLSQPAPSGGLAVSLAGNSAALTVPASVTIAAGNSTAYFTVSAGTAGADIAVMITASLADASTTTTLTIHQSSGLARLVAAYSFSEGAGNTIADTSGNGNTGTIRNAAWSSSGKYGNALQFNGTNSLVSINDSASLHLTTGLTLEAWVKPSAVNNAWTDVIYKGRDAYFLEATSDSNNVPAGGGTFNGAVVSAYATAGLAVDVWSHLAVTYDGNALRLYINGAPASTRAQAGVTAASTSPLQIGGDDIFGQYFAGLIDEVKIYNGPLTQSQILADMYGGATSAGPALGLSSSALIFPNQLIGVASASQTVVLTNTGAGDMTLGGLTVSGPNASEFRVAGNCGKVLAAGAACTMNVIYIPSHTGTASASILIADDAPGNPHSLTLSGTGISSSSSSLSPAVAIISPVGTQQFVFSGGSGTMLWSVDGISGGSAATGTITNSGLYSAPNQAGLHTVTASTSDLSQSASASVFVSTASAPLLRLSSNHRYAVDQNNVPVMILGDSPQSLIGNLSEMDAARYFANRQAAGFNAVWINLLCRSYTACNSNGSAFDGIPPFLAEDDISTPNEEYFKRVDHMISMAAQFGLVVFLNPVETGGWLNVLRTNGTAKAFNYGTYVGNRYKNWPNIVWLHGNDFQTWRDPNDDALVLAVARGIRSADPNHLQTVELNYQLSASSDDSAWTPLISFNAAYTYFPTYAEVLQAYNQPNPIPVLMIEANYEFEHQVNDNTNPETLRRQEYWAALSGAAGQFYGSHYTWTFTAGWQTNLDTPGTLQLGYLKNLLSGRRWYELIPDQSHAVVTQGYGSFRDTGAISSSDYVTVSVTADGSLAIAYLPTARTITVDMSRFPGAVQARWYDPANGSYIPISGAPFPNAGSRQFTPPGQNSAGDGDWVLVIEK